MTLAVLISPPGRLVLSKPWKMQGRRSSQCQACCQTEKPRPVRKIALNAVSTLYFFLNEVHYYCPLIVLLLHYIYIYAFSRRFYPKRLTVNSGYTFLSVCVPWELNPTFCAANAMLYHWATGTSVQITKIVKSPLLLDHKIDFFGCVVIRSTLTKISLIHFVLFHILIILLSLFM